MPPGFVTTDLIDFNEIWYGGVIPALDQYRRVDLPIITSLALPWPEQVLKYGVSEKNGYQLLSPGQRPDRKYVTEATTYPVVKKYGYGHGTDLDTLRRSDARQVRMALNRGFAEDPENVLLQFLKVMMTDPSTNNAGYGWYNGQFAPEEKITAPPKFQQNVFLANHTHYYRSGASTLGLGAVTAAKATIRHHGHMGPLAAVINSAQVQQLEDLAAFTASALIRTPISDEISVQGFTDRFTLLGVTWHASEMMPAGYVGMFEINQAEDERPLVMYEPANMRGLQLFPGPLNDYPLVESYFERWFGVKVWRRGAGVAIQIATAGSYDNPTFNE